MKKFYIFAEHETHANSIREYFNKIEVENCKVVSASGLIGNFISKPLIVPYLPVHWFSKMLTSMSVSVRLIAFLSQNEKQSFLGRLQQAETQNRKLAISSYKSFANTPIEKTMKGIVKRFRQLK